MLEFVWPQTTGETLAWLSALLVMIFGAWMFLMPRKWLGWTNLQTMPGRDWAVAQYRGPVGGMLFGYGFATLMLHPQPLLYLALGIALGCGALGRLVSILIDNGNNRQNWSTLAIDSLLAFFPLAYAFGLIR